MSDKWKALERLRERAAGGNAADEDCNIINLAFRELEADNKEADRLLLAAAMKYTGLEAKLSKMEEALGQIVEWSKAYPIDVLPEPDFKKVAKVLKDNGMTLDAVSASNMRHVITEVASMAREALAGGEEA